MRGAGVTANLLRDSKRRVQVRAVYDPDRTVAANAVALWGQPALLCRSYQDAIRAPGVDWVLVFSPNAYHKQHILAVFAAGKHVFSEKPLATSLADCQAIYDAHQRSNRMFATGFVLRYAPIYRKARQLLESGALGRVLSIDANENIAPGHGGYIMINWRRHTKLAGPHLLEKCCHDLDLLNWFTQSLPARVAAFGGLDFFVPKNQGYLRKYGRQMFVSWLDPHGVDSPFTSDKDLCDNQVAILEYRNGIRVTFQATMSNAIPERRMYVSCTDGTLIVELYKSLLQYRRLGDKRPTVIDFAADGHGGGDDHIMKELFECMATGAAPKSGGDEGLESAVVALALDQAMRKRTVINLEPVWHKLRR